MKYSHKVLWLLLSINIVFSSINFANSGPMTIDESSVNGIYSLSDSPAEVTREELTFNFSNQDLLYTPTCSVTADYHLYNPTDEPLTVQVGFPLTSSFKALESRSHIEYNQQTIHPDIQVRPQLSTVDSSFDEIIRAFNHQSNTYDALQSKSIERYEIQTDLDQLADGESITIYVHSPQIDSILSKGSRSSGFQDDTFFFSYDQYSRHHYFYVIGGPTDNLTFEYTQHNKIVDHASSIDYVHSPVTLDDFTADLLSEIDHPRPFSDKDLVNLAFDSFDYYRRSKAGELIFNLDEIMLSPYQWYLMMYTYHIELEPHSENNMVISYDMNGLMDQSETQYPLYTYEYYLDPASHWSDFNDLTIKIIPPDESPYITNSNITFNQNESYYEAHFDNIPDEKLTFTLNKEATPSHYNQQSSYGLLIILYIVMRVAIILIPILAIILIMRHLIKRKNSQL